MTHAVTLRLDDGAAGRVSLLRQALMRTGGGSAVAPNYPPHVTLALLPDGVAEPAVRTAVAGWEALPVSLAGLAVFPGVPPVVWAVPVVTEALLARHAALTEALAPCPVHPYYRVGAWVPHVTLSLAGGLDAGAAIGVAAEAWTGPVGGWLDRVELVELAPLRLAWGMALPRPRPRLGG